MTRTSVSASSIRRSPKYFSSTDSIPSDGYFSSKSPPTVPTRRHPERRKITGPSAT